MLPRIKEYERTSTTVVNAYVGPLIARYLAGLRDRLAAAGYGGPILVMQSHGGVAPIEETIRIAAGTVLSGPAGGLAGARRVAGLAGTPNLISLDMGGTSSDVSLVVDGRALLAVDKAIAREKIALPSLDITTLGAGGGSIARVDGGGLLKVGPESAGAVPGPACYGRGGREATLTDASVVLGYLDPDNFLGGAARLDRQAALDALARVGAAFDLDAVRGGGGACTGWSTPRWRRASGWQRCAAAWTRAGSRSSGFGGAAGLQATALARLLHVRRVLVPRVASVLSAWGMLGTELRFEAIRSHIGDTGGLDVTALRAVYDGLEAEGRARMADWTKGTDRLPARGRDAVWGAGLRDRRASRRDRLRLAFPVPGPQARLRDPARGAVHLCAGGPGPGADQRAGDHHRRPPLLARRAEAPAGKPAAPAGTRRIHLGEWREVPVYAFDTLAASQVVTGPAIVESDTTTVLLRPGDEATTTPQRWLDVRLPE